MEIFLNLWDELDDLLGACRHVATATALEATGLAKPLARTALAAAVTLTAAGQAGWASFKSLI